MSLVLLALALTLAVDNWRTGIGWDETGPQPGYFPFYLSVIQDAASLFGLISAVFVTRDQFRRVLAVFVPTLLFCLLTQFLGLYVASFLADRGIHALRGQDSALEIASDRLAVHFRDVRDLRYRVRRLRAEGTARSGLRLLARRI